MLSALAAAIGCGAGGDAATAGSEDGVAGVLSGFGAAALAGFGAGALGGFAVAEVDPAGFETGHERDANGLAAAFATFAAFLPAGAGASPDTDGASEAVAAAPVPVAFAEGLTFSLDAAAGRSLDALSVGSFTFRAALIATFAGTAGAATAGADAAVLSAAARTPLVFACGPGTALALATGCGAGDGGGAKADLAAALAFAADGFAAGVLVGLAEGAGATMSVAVAADGDAAAAAFSFEASTFGPAAAGFAPPAAPFPLAVGLVVACALASAFAAGLGEAAAPTASDVLVASPRLRPRPIACAILRRSSANFAATIG